MSSATAFDQLPSPADLETGLRRYILTDLAADPLRRLDPDTPLFETLLDSTSVLALVGHLEQQYQIEIQDSEVVPGHFSSLRRLVEFLGNKLSAAGQSTPPRELGSSGGSGASR